MIQVQDQSAKNRAHAITLIIISIDIVLHKLLDVNLKIQAYSRCFLHISHIFEEVSKQKLKNKIPGQA